MTYNLINIYVYNMLMTLHKYINTTVVDAALDIWPCETWPEDTDTKLYLKLQSADGDIHHLVIDSEPDGQTPRLKLQGCSYSANYSELGSRVAAWGRGENCDSSITIEREVFGLLDAPYCSNMIGAKLSAVELVHSVDLLLVEGLLFYFSSGQILWSIAGTNGNTINFGFDRRYLGDEIKFIKTRIDMDCI